MSAHTPGPWVAQGREGLEVMGPDFRIVTVETPPNDREALEAAQADARLIAAAPDLLAALQGLMEYVGGWDEGSKHPCGVAVAALKKARGQ